MTAAESKRRPDYRPELRREAAEAIEKHGSIRAAAEAMGLSPKRVWELAKEHETTTTKGGAK